MNNELNNVISFKYIARDADTGEVYENTYGEKPLEIILGRNQVLAPLEDVLKTTEPGTEQKVFLEKPYGAYDPTNFVEVPRNQVGNIPLEEGLILYAKGKHGETLQVKVKNFDEEKVIIDHNHPMAGKNLVFKLKVVNKRPATLEELEHGHIHSSGGDSCGCGSGCGCH